MRFNALCIERYVGTVTALSPFEAGEKTKGMIARLAEILDQLVPQGDDNLHAIWVKTVRPTFRQYYEENYEYDWPYKEASESIIEEAKNNYCEAYPKPKVWYKLAVKHFTRNSGEEFYALFIDHKYVFGVKDYNSREILEGTDLLEWAISEAENVVDKVREGTYRATVLEKIPYIYRTGTIKRSDLWKIYPDSKRDFFKAYRKRDLVKFGKYFGGEKPGPMPLPRMTARVFYEACAVVYKALGRQREVRSYLFKESSEERKWYGDEKQTPKEMYYANADGRDNGLIDVPMDDPDAFEEWAQGKGEYYTFNGSHPWEIIPSFDISLSMHLAPRKRETGYFFVLSGDSFPRTPETIIAANALYEAGYPVEVVGLDGIQKRLEGEDYLTVAPQNVMDLLGQTIHLPEGRIGTSVTRKVTWEFDEYALKD